MGRPRPGQGPAATGAQLRCRSSGSAHGQLCCQPGGGGDRQHGGDGYTAWANDCRLHGCEGGRQQARLWAPSVPRRPGLAPSSRPRPGQHIASGRRATGPGDPLRAPPVPVSETNGPCALASAWQARWPRDSQSHRPPRPNADDTGTLSTARGRHGLPREPQCAPGASSGEGRGRAPRPPRYLGSAQQAGHQPDGLQVALRQQQLPLLRADLLLQPALPLRLQLLQLPLAAARLAVPLLLLALAQLLLALPLPLQLLQLLLLPARNTAASGGRRVLRGRRHRRHAQRWGRGGVARPRVLTRPP